MPCGSAIVALTGLGSVMRSVSLGSGVRSPQTGSETVRLVVPGVKLSVPLLVRWSTPEAPCGDCGESIHVEIGLGGEAAGPLGTVLHVGVPAREFWNDIYFT